MKLIECLDCTCPAVVGLDGLCTACRLDQGDALAASSERARDAEAAFLERERTLPPLDAA